MIFQTRAVPPAVPALAMISVLSMAVPARAASADHAVYVDCDRGNDANSGLTPDAPKRTVWAALRGGRDGDARSLIVSGTCVDIRTTARATGMVRSHKCSADPRKGLATFRIRFAQMPDFATLDGQGRQATSFQIYADAAALVPFGDFFAALAGEADGATKTVIRGEEIHVDDTIRVRGIVPGWDEPGSGGWGPILDEVPYQLEDATVVFEVPLASLRDSGDGRLWYYLEAFAFGSWDGFTLAGVCRASSGRERPAR